jgi:hypothetical protein
MVARKLTNTALHSLVNRPSRYSDDVGLYFRVRSDGGANWAHHYASRVDGREHQSAPRPFSPVVFAFAPTVAPIVLQLACERSFKSAVYRNLCAVSLYAATPGGRS